MPSDRRISWLVLGVVVLLVALGTAVTARLADSGSSGSSPAAPPNVALPSPHAILVGGITYTVRAVRPNGVLAVPGQPDELDVLLFDTDGVAAGASVCGASRPSARIVGSDAATVRLASFAYRSARAPVRGACMFSTNVDQSLYRAIRLRLPAPLAHRQLIDMSSGQPIGILDPHALPTPGYLPSGYLDNQDQPPTPQNGMEALRQYYRGADRIEVTTSSGLVQDESGIQSVTSVGGRLAVVTEDRGSRCVVWSDRSGLLHAVCSYPAHGDYLSVGVLRRIAQSVRDQS